MIKEWEARMEGEDPERQDEVEMAKWESEIKRNWKRKRNEERGRRKVQFN